MLTARSPREALDTAFRSVERNIEIGLCAACALTMTAQTLRISRDKLEDLWIAEKVSQLGEDNGTTP